MRTFCHHCHVLGNRYVVEARTESDDTYEISGVWDGTRWCRPTDGDVFTRLSRNIERRCYQQLLAKARRPNEPTWEDMHDLSQEEKRDMLKDEGISDLRYLD